MTVMKISQLMVNQKKNKNQVFHTSLKILLRPPKNQIKTHLKIKIALLKEKRQNLHSKGNLIQLMDKGKLMRARSLIKLKTLSTQTRKINIQEVGFNQLMTYQKLDLTSLGMRTSEMRIEGDQMTQNMTQPLSTYPPQRSSLLPCNNTGKSKRKTWINCFFSNQASFMRFSMMMQSLVRSYLILIGWVEQKSYMWDFQKRHQINNYRFQSLQGIRQL